MIYPAKVLRSSRTKFIGASGGTDNFKIAPFPAAEKVDSPIKFFAYTLAKIDVPATKLKGGSINDYTLI